jgi:hypothetical protein
MDLTFITDISRNGIALELFPRDVSEVISISFVGADRRDVRINGRVAYSAFTPTGKMKLGLALLGVRSEIKLFLAEAAQTYRLNLMGPKPVHAPD